MEASVLLREMRASAGLSQRALAARLRVPQSTVARWEARTTEPSLGRLTDAATACGLRLVPRLVPDDPEVRAGIRRLLAVPASERLRAATTAGRLVLRGRRSLRAGPGGG